MSSTNCNYLFKPGLITTLLDGGAGSSGKAKIGSYITENADNWQFACNTFHPQAGHWTRLKDGRKYFYQTLNSCAYQDKYEKLYLGPGAMIELPALLREMEENNVPRHKIGISPVVPILDAERDQGFERGITGFDGMPSPLHVGTAKSGSTAHGVGSCNARRVLRRESLRLASDVPELKDMICDVPNEIMSRLNQGQAGLLELAQGFQLSLMHPYFYPFVTSRNVTVAQGFSDMMLPVMHAGPVLINFRSLPIRINSNKYISTINGRHLTWDEVQAKEPHIVYEGNSGHWYPDQKELTWDEVTQMSGSRTQIHEITSVTKLPRRVATFSRINVHEAIRHNMTPYPTYLSVNFCNYIDDAITGATSQNELTPKVSTWLDEELGPLRAMLKFIGTGAETESMIALQRINYETTNCT